MECQQAQFQKKLDSSNKRIEKEITEFQRLINESKKLKEGDLHQSNKQSIAE